MNYRISTNGVDFRIELKTSRRMGWFWNRRTVDSWLPLTKDGRYDVNENLIVRFDVYPSKEDAMATIISWKKQPVQHEWIPLTNCFTPLEAITLMKA